VKFCSRWEGRICLAAETLRHRVACKGESEWYVSVAQSFGQYIFIAEAFICGYEEEG